MTNTFFRILTKEEYQPTRCIDGIIVILPIQGDLTIQHFANSTTISDEVYIINNKDIFTIKQNHKSLMLYITSDWFKNHDYVFFDYKYSVNLIKSINKLKQLMLKIAINYINQMPITSNENYIKQMVEVIATEGSVDLETAENQYKFLFYGELSQILEYINKHSHEKLTLNALSQNLFTSKSNISAQFHQNLNMGFKQYVDSLKIAESIEYLLTENSTISHISDKLGFSNSASYTKMFKSYIGITPNDYRSLNIKDKYLLMNYEVLSEDNEQHLKTVLRQQINYYQENIERKIFIDNNKVKTKQNFELVTQINTVEEFKELFFIKIKGKANINTENLIIYVNFGIGTLINNLSDAEIGDMFKKIAANNLHIAFKIQSLEIMDYIERIYVQVVERLNYKKSLANGDRGIIMLVFDMEVIELKEIYRLILKIQNKQFGLRFGLDISCLLNETVMFKTLESQIKRIGFDYLFIDNAHLEQPYLLEDSQHLLLKNILEYQNIEKILTQIDLSYSKVIFLNIENHQFLNNENDLSNSAPLIIETFLKTAELFDGMGVNLYFSRNSFNAIHIFDENGFKTVLGIIIGQIKWMMNQSRTIKDNYIVVENEAQYTLFLYDWRVFESEASITYFGDTEVLIHFEEAAEQSIRLIKSEKVDEKNGNINHIINRHIREKYNWTQELLKEIEDHLHTTMRIIEHDFRKDYFKVNLGYDSLRIIKIFK
ncbi:helix-turn-helix domain-containing protein [Staphylococcus lugdunensis]|uniref:helix-turn-helix domain-containing protein n=1 Tax=Staphylococcus lugdunensis TaxID=28035 RepID=UPI002552CE21|nr:helix-turn-helix domain-containing protein [Staphylococcus lugdunensis]MDK7950549.1 helix-turn-helix domain-containing protein [Staphylococcus lugdunensis]